MTHLLGRRIAKQHKLGKSNNDNDDDGDYVTGRTHEKLTYRFGLVFREETDGTHGDDGRDAPCNGGLVHQSISNT